MSIDLDQIEQAYERDDLHILASQGEKNNFNVRKFRQRSLLKDKRKSMYTKYTETSTKHRISTEPIEDRVKNIKSQMSYTNAFDKLMNVIEPDYEKRNNFVGSLKHGNKKNSGSLDRSEIQRDVSTLDISTMKAKQFREMNKKNHKGPLTKKIVQTWLNSILTQSTQFQVVDETLGNAALKKFQIDENSLLSRGVKPENVHRIYQSLFVHSIGFNNQIKELVTGNIEIEKNIWKVFSVLLEYCAEGKFQTLIGVIERDKVIKVQQLRQQVAKRQQIIQSNDELNQTKNIQIFKQIKSLKQENINLTNEKEILFEDYQKTEQAFNQEVALRLKFENKINQLFGVHRELAVKHQRLYEDYKKKIIQWNALTQKNNYLIQQNGDYKIQINDLTTEKLKLLSSEKYNKQLISALKDEKLKLKDEANLAKHQYDQQRSITRQQKRRVTQLEIEVRNLSQIVIIKDKSWKETHSEYQLSLQENNRLYKVISDQRIQVEELLFDKKEFNNKILNLMAEASYEKKRRQEFQRLYYDIDSKYNQQIQKVKQLELECKILNKKNQSAAQDLQVNYENIKKMHANNIQLEEQLYDLRRFRDNLDSVIQQKDDESFKLRQQNQILIKENEELKTSLNKSEMHLKILRAQSEDQVCNLNHKIDKLKQQRETFELGDNQKNRVIVANRIEIERLTKLLQSTVLDLKNQKFERFHLKANYEQSLNIIQKKNIQEKQMGRQISQLKQLVSITNREKQRTQNLLQAQIKRRQKVEQRLSDTQIIFFEYKKQRSAYVHPFLNEDISQNFRIKKRKLQQAEIIIRKKLDEIKQLQERHINELASQKKAQDQYFNSYKKEKEKYIFQKQSQLQYEKQINASMKSRLQQLQTLADTYAKKIEERTTSQKQKLYAQLIQQKTKAIEELAQKLNIESSKTQKLSNEILTKQQIHENEIIEMKKKSKLEKDQRDQKISELNFELTHIQKQSEKLMEEIKQNQQQFEAKLKQRMSIYLENYKKSDEVNQAKLNMQQVMHQEDGVISSFNETNAKWNLMNNVERKNPQIKARNNISRKIKIAYSYYKHEGK